MDCSEINNLNQRFHHTFFKNIQSNHEGTMKPLFLFFLFSVFIASVSFSQSLRENLDYVNDQFSKYNSHEIVFNIDTDNKALVIYDEFGTLVCYFEDVEFEIAEDSETTIEIRCSDEDECIDQKKLNEEEYSAMEKYSIELEGANLNRVLETLDEIKEIVLEED